MIAFALTFILILGSITPSVLSFPVFAWERTWGGANVEVGFGVAADSSGNLYATGATQSYGAGGTCNGVPCTDVFLLKYNPSGALSWQRTWGGTNDDLGESVAVDASGNAYVTGFTWSYGTGTSCIGVLCPSVLLLKFNSTGSLLWQETWGNDSDVRGYGIALDNSGNIYVAGIMRAFASSNGHYNALLLKFNSNGGLLWARTLGDASDQVYAIAVDSSGYVYITGLAGELNTRVTLMLLKFNSTGGVIWHEGWVGGNPYGDTNSYDVGSGLAADSVGNVYVAGVTNDFGAGGVCSGPTLCSNDLILKFNSTGGLLWARSWGGSKNDGAHAVALDQSGNIFVAGTTSSFASGGTHVSLIKLSPTGSLLADQVWGGSVLDGAFGVAISPLGNIVESGFVSEAPPYTAWPGNTTVGTSNRQPFPLAMTLSTPNIQPISRNVATGTPMGNQTYAGASDALLLNYLPHPSTATLPYTNLIPLLLSLAVITAGLARLKRVNRNRLN